MPTFRVRRWQCTTPSTPAQDPATKRTTALMHGEDDGRTAGMTEQFVEEAACTGVSMTSLVHGEDDRRTVGTTEQFVEAVARPGASTTVLVHGKSARTTAARRGRRSSSWRRRRGGVEASSGARGRRRSQRCGRAEEGRSRMRFSAGRGCSLAGEVENGWA